MRKSFFNFFFFIDKKIFQFNKSLFVGLKIMKHLIHIKLYQMFFDNIKKDNKVP